MVNVNFILEHIEHAEYARDKHLADADLERLKYRATGKFEHFKEWKDNIRVAWRMRKIVKDNKGK